MKKHFYLLILAVLIFPLEVKSQDNDSSKSVIDVIQEYVELRRAFDDNSESTKPALFSYSKKDDEDAIYKIDAAILYKKLDYTDFAIAPFVQFEYISGGKDRKEKVKSGLTFKYYLYRTPNSSGRLEPEVSFWKDFYSKRELFEAKLSFNPTFPNFAIPIMDASKVKFKYNGKDNRWVYGLNPNIGFDYQRQTGPKKKDDFKTYDSFASLSFTVKRYYLQFDLTGRVEREINPSVNYGYKYEGTATLYLDEKERSSINAKFEQEERDDERKRRITIGLGLKL
jgi:hypothetical protein